ncbi:MAG TPA: hypothetical protein VL947_00010 [Cytophagales bacterium]|nr:hypothetical protein [Cytophagales bacterium]
MNSRKTAKYITLAFTLLLADLIKEYVLHRVGWKKDFVHPYKSTLVGMLITVAVYYPVFTILDQLVEKFVEVYLSNARKRAGGGLVGLTLAVLIGTGVLFVFYLKLWFKKSIF